jgi:hypothetical protein
MGSCPEQSTDATDPLAVLVQFGARHVFTHRSIPDEVFEQVGCDLCALQHVAYEGPNQRNLRGGSDTQGLSHYIYEVLGHASVAPGTEYGGVERVTDNSVPEWVKAVVRRASEAVAA